MRDVVEQVQAWSARGDRVAVATVVATRRSAPRPPGAKMAVNDRGEVHGAVSGGCVESSIVAVAQDVLAGAPPRLCPFGFDDDEAWAVGLPCGGEIDVFVERYDPDGPQGAFAQAARTGERAVLLTTVRGPGAGEHRLLRVSGPQAGDPGDPARPDDSGANELLWAERSELRDDTFIDVTAPLPRLLIFGAVDYARHLSHLARVSGWRPYVIDPRAAFAAPERFPDAEAVIAAWPHAAIEQLGGLDRATYLAILTHDPKIDDEAIRIALAAKPAYIGALGSRRTQAKRRERLLEAGVAEADLDRISAPIGLDLGAVGSEEIAVSIMAELLAVKHGRQGGRLSQRTGAIAVGA